MTRKSVDRRKCDPAKETKNTTFALLLLLPKSTNLLCIVSKRSDQPFFPVHLVRTHVLPYIFFVSLLLNRLLLFFETFLEKPVRPRRSLSLFHLLSNSFLPKKSLDDTMAFWFLFVFGRRLSVFSMMVASNKHPPSPQFCRRHDHLSSNSMLRYCE